MPTRNNRTSAGALFISRRANSRLITFRVSDGGQPPLTFDLFLSLTAASRSLHPAGSAECSWPRFVRLPNHLSQRVNANALEIQHSLRKVERHQMPRQKT